MKKILVLVVLIAGGIASKSYAGGWWEGFKRTIGVAGETTGASYTKMCTVEDRNNNNWDLFVNTSGGAGQTHSTGYITRGNQKIDVNVYHSGDQNFVGTCDGGMKDAQGNRVKYTVYRQTGQPTPARETERRR